MASTVLFWILTLSKSLVNHGTLLFRWLFKYGRFESTRWLFHANRTMSIRYLINAKIVFFVIGCMSSDRMLLRGLAKYVMFNGKVSNVFCKHNVIVYYNVQAIKEVVNCNFSNYCNECP